MSETNLSELSLLERRLRTVSAGIAADWGLYIRFLATGD